MNEMNKKKNKGIVEVIKDDDSKQITAKNPKRTKTKFLEVPFEMIKDLTPIEIKEKYHYLLAAGYQLQITIV